MSVIPLIPYYINYFKTYEMDLLPEDFIDKVEKIIEACRFPYDKKGNVFKVRIVEIENMMDGEVSIFRTETDKNYAVEVSKLKGCSSLAVRLSIVIDEALKTGIFPVYPVELKSNFGTLTPQMELIVDELPPLSKEKADESIKPLLADLESGYSKYSLDRVQTLCRLMKTKHFQRIIAGRSDVVEVLVKLLNPNKKISLETQIYATKALCMILNVDPTPIEPTKATILEWITELCSEPTTRQNFYLKEFLEELRQILTSA
jgi:hypothetical protein